MLKDISLLTTQSAQLSDRRHQEAEDELIFGMLCLEKFESTGFNQTELLKEGCRRLINAIKLNTRDIRPHLGLIYLFTLIEDFETAQMYVASAQALDLENPFLLAMQEFLRETRKQVQEAAQSLEAIYSSAAAGSDTNSNAIDFDELYDKVEAYIQDLIKKLSQMSPPDPTVQTELVKTMNATLHKLQKSQQKIMQDIELIDQEIDAEDLRVAVKPLEVSIKRLEQNLELSQKMLALHKELKQDLALVEQVSEEAEKIQDPSDLQVLEENVEVLLDHCDQFADQLEALEQQRIKVADLMKSYNQLIKDVESFQDLVEDAIERLRT